MTQSSVLFRRRKLKTQRDCAVIVYKTESFVLAQKGNQTVLRQQNMQSIARSF